MTAIIRQQYTQWATLFIEEKVKYTSRRINRQKNYDNYFVFEETLFDLLLVDLLLTFLLRKVFVVLLLVLAEPPLLVRMWLCLLVCSILRFESSEARSSRPLSNSDMAAILGIAPLFWADTPVILEGREEVVRGWMVRGRWRSWGGLR